MQARRCRQGKAPEMAKKKERVEQVWLVCEETGQRNYIIARRRGIKVRVKKFCPKLRKHTWHAEKKK
jgi:large subunit ribosomal protein L33